MSRDSNYLGESTYVDMGTPTVDKPTQETDGKARSNWDGFFNIKSILCVVKSVTATAYVWIYEGVDGSETWQMAQKVTFSETTNEAEAVEGLCRAKRIYIQFASAANVTSAGMQFFG
jgi:hypothetical protein